uniref:Uncharacterized protein n=1 Tax=Arundo donax TaxID=35708 RepID=A0A0A9HBF0_ARUDO
MVELPFYMPPRSSTRLAQQARMKMLEFKIYQGCSFMH